MNQSKNILIYILIAIIALGGGYYLGVSIEKNKAKQAREAMLKEVFSGVFSVGNLSGKISEISPDKKSFILEVPGIFGVNLPQDYQKKKIFIAENTKITLRENKIMEDFRKEVAANKKEGNMILPPLPYTEKEIKIDDLKIGDDVNVGLQLQGNQSILDNQFTALQIYVVK